MDIEQIKGALKEHESKIEAAIAKYEGQLKDAGTVASEARAEVKVLAEKHSALVDTINKVEQKLADKAEGKTARKSLGEELVTSEMFKAYKDGRSSKLRMEVKNTIIGESGSPQDPSSTIVGADRLPGIVGGAFRRLSVLDAILKGATSSNMVEYTKELAFTNAAAETAEGVTKPESTLTFSLVQEPVRTIAHWIKVSKQVLDDAPALQSYIDMRLRHGVELKLEQQVVAGDGTGKLLGLLGTGNYTAFTPTDASYQEADTVNDAKYRVIAADYQPSVVLMNPVDFGRLERRKTAAAVTGSYIAGEGAALSYINNGMTPMLWGLPVIVSNSVPEDGYIVYAADACQLFMRSGAVVEMFEQDDTNVQKNLITVRAELRAALAVYRPAAVVAGGLRAGSPVV
ncbi:MAG TPA: phage major capsid protein [Steroidobacteraceae bacterium]|nr:phage major capsid protein [Steroidobacteraceae bacterium]